MAGVTGAAAAGVAEGLRIERRGAAAAITIDRPAALNALSIAMRGALIEALSGFGRDPSLYVVILRSAVPGTFSVGGDIREIVRLAGNDPAAARSGLAGELRLCWIVECLSKPAVSLVDGRVMGTGVGISLYNTHRVAGEGYRFAMPETQIGYFPDCGVARAFALMPHAIGLYLGLTGREVGPADALALGLVTHCIPAARFAEIEARLADADPIDPILDGLHEEPAAGPIMAEAARIERFFGAPDLAGIMARLRSAQGEDRAFAEATLATLASRSPLALAVTDRLIRAARNCDIREALILDYRLAHRLVQSADLHEGVRAYLVEKTRAPRWSPARLEDVDVALVEGLLAPLGADELDLPTRAAMQVART